LVIKGAEEIEEIVREFKKREAGRKGKTLGGFRVVSSDLREELNARVYEVICEYKFFPSLGDWRKQVVKVRAISGEIISYRDL
jgi:hypothetical protein